MKLASSRLSTKELATLVQRVVTASRSGKYTVIAGNELILALEIEAESYNKVYSKLSYSGKGPDVAAADLLRDKHFGGIKMFLKGYKDIESMPNRADAVALYEVLERFGLDIDRLNYAEETAQLNKLIQELEKPENQTHMTNLNLKPAFDDLKAAQANFEAIYAEQAEANAALRAMPSATVIRRPLEKALRNYLALLTAMRDVAGWELLYAEVNELVKAAAAGYKTGQKENPGDIPTLPTGEEPKEEDKK